MATHESGEDAIIFSANPESEVADAIKHLDDHHKLYWAVPFPIKKEKFSFPMDGFIHISGEQIHYKATIQNIIPFSPKHYEDEEVKPRVWRDEWKDPKYPRKRKWKHELVITRIVLIRPRHYNSFEKSDGTRVQRAPRSYVRVLPPTREFK